MLSPDYEISTDQGRIDVNVVHDFLCHSYWAEGRSPQYAVAADGRCLLNVVASDAVVSSITLVMNGTGLLPR
jgi:hypothetical protein